MPEGSENSIAFASCSLSSNEQKYAQLALSLVYGVKALHQYLYGRRFELLTGLSLQSLPRRKEYCHWLPRDSNIGLSFSLPINTTFILSLPMTMPMLMVYCAYLWQHAPNSPSLHWLSIIFRKSTRFLSRPPVSQQPLETIDFLQKFCVL